VWLIRKGKQNEAPTQLEDVPKPRKIKQRWQQKQDSTAVGPASPDADDADANRASAKEDPGAQ